MSRPIAQLRNLGPAIGAQLGRIEVRTEGDSLNALYAMDAALQDRHWLDLGEARKRELKAAAAFDAADL